MRAWIIGGWGRRVSGLALVTVTALGVASCSSSTSGGDGGSTDLQTPVTTFSGDVLPLFVASCAFSGCHDSPTGQLEYLGNKSDMPSTFAQQVYDNVVNKATIEAPGMKFVVPGDLANSFMMRKLDNDLSSIQSQCAMNNSLSMQYMEGPCGVSMPQNLPLLDSSRRDIVRRWIAQGALNN